MMSIAAWCACLRSLSDGSGIMGGDLMNTSTSKLLRDRSVTLFSSLSSSAGSSSASLADVLSWSSCSFSFELELSCKLLKLSCELPGFSCELPELSLELSLGFSFEFSSELSLELSLGFSFEFSSELSLGLSFELSSELSFELSLGLSFELSLEFSCDSEF